MPAAGRDGATPGAGWGGMERRIWWNREPRWQNRESGCGAGRPHAGVGMAPGRAKPSFPGVLRAFRAHQFGDHHSGDHLTILVRPVRHAWSAQPSAGRLWPRRRYQPGVVRNWEKHGKISRKQRHNSSSHKSLGDWPFPRGRRAGHEKNIESGQPPDDLRPRSTAPPPQSPQGTAHRRYLPVGRTSSDVMPTATFITAHLHAHSHDDTSRRQESHNTLVPTKEKTCTLRAR